MKKTKLEKGITLVALIITIVVLLILAVVSIGAVRNSGIIGHATNTSDAWKQGQVNETTDLKEYEEFLNEYNTKSPYDDVWEEISNLYKSGKIEKDEFGDRFITISDHIMISASGSENEFVLFYGDAKNDNWEYIIFSINGKDKEYGDIKANRWYLIVGSGFDFNTKLGLPNLVFSNKSGTPVSGYEGLCDKFNKAVEAHAENIKTN